MSMQKQSIIMILAAGILWGILGTFVRALNAGGLASMDVVFIRAACTVLILLPILILRRRREWRVRIKDLWIFLGTGIGSIVFFNYCYFRAVTMTSLSVAAVLLYTAPAFVIVLSAMLFKEQITMYKVAALVLTLVGLVFVTGLIGSESALSAAGILYGLGSGLGYALYSIFGRFAVRRGCQPLTITFYTFLVAAISSAALTEPVRVASVFADGPVLLVPAVLLGGLCTVCPFLLYTMGLRHVENGAASIMASIEPVTSTVMGVILYHEILAPGNALGVALVLAGVVISNLQPRRAH